MRFLSFITMLAGVALAEPVLAAPPVVGNTPQQQLLNEAATARAAEAAAQTAASAASTTAGTASTTATAAQTAAATATAGLTALQPVAVSVTATGTTQASALAIAANREIVTSAPSGSGLVLVATIPEVRIYNRDPANPILIYPPTGGTIEAQAANAAVQLNAGTDSLCTLAGSGAWRCSN